MSAIEDEFSFDQILAYYIIKPLDDLQFARMKRYTRDINEHAFNVRELGFPEIIASADEAARIANMAFDAATKARSVLSQAASVPPSSKQS